MPVLGTGRKERQEMNGMVEKTGVCRFCGQVRMIERTEDEWLDLIRKTNTDGQTMADFQAALECDCKEGADFRTEQRIFKETNENIEIMFGDDYPEIADTFQNLKAAIWHNRLKRVKISTHENEVAEMSRTQNRIRIAMTRKKQSEMITSG